MPHWTSWRRRWRGSPPTRTPGPSAACSTSGGGTSPPPSRTCGAPWSWTPTTSSANLHLLALYQRAKDPRQAAQAQRVKNLEAAREQKTEEFRRVIEVRPN